jgi:hypothetical protein
VHEPDPGVLVRVDRQLGEQLVERLAVQRVEVGPRTLAGAHPVHRREVLLPPPLRELARVDTGQEVGDLLGHPRVPVDGRPEDVTRHDADVHVG